MENLGYNPNPVESISEIKTTDIDSEEADIFERKIKFEELASRLEAHR